MSQVAPRLIHMLLMLVLCGAAPAAAQEGTAEEPPAARIAFSEGADRAAMQGRIRGPESAEYLLAAAAGKWMRVELTASNAGAHVNVFAPGSAEAMHIGSVSGNVFAGIVPVTGDYRIQVALMRSAARRNEQARFTLTAAVVDRADAARAAEPADSADALASGPDHWQVTGLPRGQRLNLRDGPSGRARVLGRLPAGEVLRNRGCRMAEGERWCRVERSEGAQGWASGRYLREAEAPAMPSAPGRPAAAPAIAPAAPASLRPFDATGLLPCAMLRGQPSRECRFGVERRGDGAAVVEVLGSNGVTRRISFEGGVPARSDAADELRFEKFGVLFLIRIGDERFEVPEAVLTGG